MKVVSKLMFFLQIIMIVEQEDSFSADHLEQVRPDGSCFPSITDWPHDSPEEGGTTTDDDKNVDWIDFCWCGETGKDRAKRGIKIG